MHAPRSSGECRTHGPSVAGSAGELRNARLVSVALGRFPHVSRADKLRIISAREANRREREAFEEGD